MIKVTVAQERNDERGFLACLTTARSGELLFAIGGTNHETTILASADGRNVHPCATPTASGLRGGVVDRAGRLWVAGEYGLVAVSDDDGMTWKQATAGTRGCLYAIAHNAHGELVVCGDGGFVATSRDGKRWKPLPLKITCEVFRVVSFVGDGDGDGDGEDFLLRADGKLTIWNGKRALTVATGFGKALTGLVERDGTLWLVGDAGACAKSLDRGRTWKKVTLPAKASWEAIARVGDELLIVGSGGSAVMTKGGSDFRVVKTGTDEHLWSICAVDGGAFIGGDGGLLLRVEDPKKPLWGKRKDALAKRPRPDDRHFASDLSKFLPTRFADYIGAKPRKATELNDFKPVWGAKPPEGLVTLTNAFNKPKRELHEWRYDDGGLPNPPKETNLFELLVTRDQKNYLGTGLFEAFGGLHFIGYQGNGDYYLIETTPKVKGANQIIHFDHETFEFSPFADSANSFALFTSACTSQRDRQLSAAAWKRVAAHLARRISPTWHFRSSLDGAKFGYKGDSTSAARIWRSRWIIYLLRQDGVVAMEDIPETFDARFNPALNEETYTKVAAKFALPPVALWGLWTAFFFDNQSWLDRLLPLAKKEGARLTRDAARLIEELLAGRKKLGTIKDIHKLRKEFLALDLNPAREEERKKEKRKDAKQESKAKKAAASEIEEAAKRNEDLVELAWTHAGDLGAQEALWKLARKLPWMEDAMRRLDWLAAEPWNDRENLSLDHEQEEVIEVFLERVTDEALTLLVPLWVGHALTDGVMGKRVAWPRSLRLLRDLARLRPIDPRAAVALRPLLAKAERYEGKRQAVLWALGAMKDRGSVDTIVKLLDVAKPTKGPYYLDFGDAEGLTKAALWALGEIGDPSAGEAILGKLKKWGPTAHEMNRYMARALRTVGTASAIETLLDLAKRLHKETNHDEGVTEMLWTAAILGADAPAKLKKEWAARLPPASEYRDNINIARDIALRAFTGKTPSSLEASVTQILKTSPNASSWDRKRTELALRAVLFATELPIADAAPFATGEDLAFRRQARAILASRNQPVPKTVAIDLFALDGTSDEALARMLRDERCLFRSRVVDYAAAKKRVALRPAIVDRVRSLLEVIPKEQRDLSTEVEYALFWAVKGLIALGLDDASRALFNDLLMHPNRNAKDPVLRYAPRDRALTPGMKHVLGENWAWQAQAARDWLKAK